MTKKKQSKTPHEPARIAGGEKPFSTLLKAFAKVDPVYDDQVI